MIRARIVTRRVPGFVWVQLGVCDDWRWNVRGYWSVRGFAKSRRFGPLWVCTMRTDCLERAKKEGTFQ